MGAFIDAEGCYVMDGTKSLLQVVNTEPEHISTLLRVTGCGAVYCRQLPGRKLSLLWVVFRKLDVQAIAEQTAPYSLKAQAALLIIANRLLGNYGLNVHMGIGSRLEVKELEAKEAAHPRMSGEDLGILEHRIRERMRVMGAPCTT